ncbi:MAG TPA: TRAP transporter large permease subunit, partial [Burkholderiaceae bacterium]|nr:TRAP transporter large permease subunit [Burkholderiaceae bacterium]
DLVWFGVLLAVNMQTSFLHPPFGFALFYLRSVAPKSVRTPQIYWGAVPFLVIQVLMIAVVIAFPALVTGGLDKEVKVDMKAVGAQVLEQLNENQGADFGTAPPLFGNIPSPGAAASSSGKGLPGPDADAANSDLMKDIQNSLGK